METVFDYLISALAKDYVKYPSKYSDYGFLTGIHVARRIYENSRYYSISNIEKMSDEELLTEAQSYLGMNED